MEVSPSSAGLLIYRPNIVRPILDSDAAFYRPNGEHDFAAITRVAAAGEQGELLGYGARNYFEPQGALVTITTESGIIYMFFVSNPDMAEAFARERALDIQDYTAAPVNVSIDYP
ncbi:MAG: hypothetical protein QOE70_2672 [Chthoniobacter sp.]|nr:hypothetical protein [Chthoniobacter sp.]